MKKKIYIIDGKTYLKHINDKVHLYGLLHQLAFLRAGSRTRRTCSMCWTR